MSVGGIRCQSGPSAAQKLVLQMQTGLLYKWRLASSSEPLKHRLGQLKMQNLLAPTKPRQRSHKPRLAGESTRWSNGVVLGNSYDGSLVRNGDRLLKYEILCVATTSPLPFQHPPREGREGQGCQVDPIFSGTYRYACNVPLTACLSTRNSLARRRRRLAHGHFLAWATP